MVTVFYLFFCFVNPDVNLHGWWFALSILLSLTNVKISDEYGK